MKRDWDLIRKQLTDIEEENELFSEIPLEPQWKDQSEVDFTSQVKLYKSVRGRILGHLELLIESGYIEGILIRRTSDGLVYACRTPRLTMAGYDLLETMRSDTIWGKIKSTAKEKGVELTFDVIKAISASILPSVFG